MRDAKQRLAVHVEEGMGGELRGLAVEIEPRAARADLAGLVGGGIAAQEAGADAGTATGRRQEHGRRCAVAEKRRDVGLVLPGQGPRGDFGRENKRGAALAERDPAGGKFQRGQEAEAGGVDVVGRRRPIGHAEPAHDERRRRGQRLVGYTAGAEHEVDVFEGDARPCNGALGGANGEVDLVLVGADMAALDTGEPLQVSRIEAEPAIQRR